MHFTKRPTYANSKLKIVKRKLNIEKKKKKKYYGRFMCKNDVT